MGGEISIEGGNVIFKLTGADKIMALKNKLVVPLEHVVDVSTDNVPWNPFKQIRVGGTGLYGVVKDGRFISNEGMLFYEMHDTEKCVTVLLKEETYKKVIFQVEDKLETAKRIKNAIKK